MPPDSEAAGNETEWLSGTGKAREPSHRHPKTRRHHPSEVNAAAGRHAPPPPQALFSRPGLDGGATW